MSILTQAAVIAAIVWGTVPECSGVQQQFATLGGHGVLAQTKGECTIIYNRRRSWPWGKLCTTTIHEWGHLTSHGHSDNPLSVMFSIYHGTDARCQDYGGPYISSHRCRDPRLTSQRKALGCPTVRAAPRIVGRTSGLASKAIRTATALDRTPGTHPFQEISSPAPLLT
jgi:hypothetical protein